MPSRAAQASAATRGQAGAKFQSISAAGHQAKARFCGGNAEAAAVLDISVSGLEALLVRAKRTLRAAFDDER